MTNPDLPKLTNNWRDMLRSFAEARTGDNEFLPNGSLRYGHIRRALSDLTAAETERDALRDWVADATHHPGCSGGFIKDLADGEPDTYFPCKCGLTALRKETT